MKKISGNKLLVKALKEEGVDILFGYPGACTIDISDEIYKQDYTKVGRCLLRWAGNRPEVCGLTASSLRISGTTTARS